jgi:predicted ATPase
LARELSHPFSVAYALLMAARFHFFSREAQAAWERAEALIVLCASQGFALRMAQGTIFRGWALSMQGQGEEGIAQLREGRTTCRATGAEFFRASYLALLAEAYQKMGQVEEGLDALVEALAVVDNTGERLWEAELYRLRGDLTLREANQKAKIGTSSQPLILSAEAEAEAEACFHKAIEIAQRQQAKSLELRAVMSLVRLRQQQMTQLDSRTTHHETRTNLDVAHKMLADVYRWFTEGLGTKDLQAAKALLAELS